MKRLLVLAAILSGFAATLWPQNNWPQLFVRDMSGNTHDFRDYAPEKGVTLFVFWKTCCPNNITMIEELYEVWEEYDNQDNPVRIVLVSVDDPRTASRVRPIVGSNRWEWEVIMDTNSDLARRYNIILPPQWLALDSSGNTVFKSKITSGTLDSFIYFEELVNQINKPNLSEK